MGLASAVELAAVGSDADLGRASAAGAPTGVELGGLPC